MKEIGYEFKIRLPKGFLPFLYYLRDKGGFIQIKIEEVTRNCGLGPQIFIYLQMFMEYLPGARLCSLDRASLGAQGRGGPCSPRAYLPEPLWRNGSSREKETGQYKHVF